MKFKPDVTGPAGLGWRADVEVIRRKGGNRPDAGVASWYVSAPWANMAWHSYALDCIHLREVAGLGAPVIHLPGATHEVMVWALDPGWELNPAEVPLRLMPVNFAGQFMCADDETARRRMEETVREIVEGRLNPDTDGRGQWIERFGDAMLLNRERKGDSVAVIEGVCVVQGTGGGVLRALAGGKRSHQEN